MALSFVVETGSGSTTATAYVSVSYADDYFEAMPEEVAWTGITNADKEYYLIWASRLLDQKTLWRGTKAVTTSALRWPRSGVYDKDDLLLDDASIPRAVKDATCEMARFLVNYDPTVGQGADNIKRIVADVVEIEYQDGTAQSDWPSLINDILRPLGSFKSRSHGFGRILRT